MTHSSRVKHISFPDQRRDHFTSSDKRSERNTLIKKFCIERVFFANQRGASKRDKLRDWWRSKSRCDRSVTRFLMHPPRRCWIRSTNLLEKLDRKSLQKQHTSTESWPTAVQHTRTRVGGPLRQTAVEATLKLDERRTCCTWHRQTETQYRIQQTRKEMARNPNATLQAFDNFSAHTWVERACRCSGWRSDGSNPPLLTQRWHGLKHLRHSRSVTAS